MQPLQYDVGREGIASASTSIQKMHFITNRNPYTDTGGLVVEHWTVGVDLEVMGSNLAAT